MEVLVWKPFDFSCGAIERHFQIAVQHAAEGLFKTLHPQFEVETFLLGIARKSDPKIHPVCLEPEECGFRPEDFESVRDAAKHHLAIDPEREVICWHPEHQKATNRRVENRALRNAVLSVLNSWHGQKSGNYYFWSFAPLGDYDVGVVLRLHCTADEKPYHLPKVHAEERYVVPSSLIEAAVSEFLFDCGRSLYTVDPESVADLNGRKTDELLRQAGNRLMEVPVFAGGEIYGLYGLFDSCNFISSMTYESEGSVGSMIVARPTHKNVERTLTLAKPVYLGNHRAVRKLLQIAATGDSLLCDGSNVIGFGHVTGIYNQADGDLFEVRFTQHYRWELLHAGHRMMRVSYGTPALPLPPLNPEKLASDLSRIFKGLKGDCVQRLASLALEACNQRHGALLVITPEAEKEAQRLEKQCTRIEPLVPSPTLIGSLSAIDGAVLLSPECVCYAIGVILDGQATPFGDPSRGARYNSSLRYVAERNNCVAIIISEDGTAEWIPNLLPRINRKDLDDMRSELKRLLEHPEELTKGRKAINWLDDHRFYLPPDLCELANKFVSMHKKKVLDEGLIAIEYRPFEPNPGMNDEYLQD
jgi:hypothetical protein